MGFAGDDAPRAVFPTVVLSYSHSTKEPEVGVTYLRTNFRLTYPVKRATVMDWPLMERVYKHSFCRELRVSAEEHMVLLAESPLTARADREKTTQVMFEECCTRALSLVNSGVLSLYAAGRATGVALCSGSGATHSVPVYEGHALAHATHTVDFAGVDIACGQHCGYLSKLLQERDYHFTMPHEHENLQAMKEKVARVALDFTQELAGFAPTTYELPDGSKLNVGSELIRCTEPLFQPSLIGKQSLGVHEAVHKTILKCDADLHNELFGHVVLAGGNTLLSGFAERLRKELMPLAPAPEATLRVIAQPERKFASWIGGSILGCLGTFPQMCITRKDYDEQGPSIVHRKCF